ncbi:MAG: hypothetical protein JJT82_01320 [Legionellaceae bacterium]|nr:hypothetical protein [Legionellaceae bacterium]
MSSIHETLMVFAEYLASDSTSLLEERMQFYRNRRGRLKKDFHRLRINTPELQKDIRAILDRLEVAEPQKSRYYNAALTVYEFLAELRTLIKPKHDKLNEFLQRIEQQNQAVERLLNLVLGTFIILTSFLLAGGVKLVQAIFTNPFIVPAASLLYTLAVAAYSLYQSLSKPDVSFWDQCIENFALLASTALQVAAYTALLVAATTMAPVAGILFVAAAAVSVVKLTIDLIRLAVKDRKNGAIQESDTLAERQQKLRDAVAQKKARNLLLIELGAAVLMVGIVAASAFVSGGMVVGIVLVALMAVLYLAKYLVTRYHDKYMQSALEADFARVEAEDAEKAFELAQTPKAVPPGQNYPLQPESRPETEGCRTQPSQTSTLARLSRSGMFSASALNGKTPADTNADNLLPALN